MGNGTGECAECGRASFWGGDAQHSSADAKERQGAAIPLPNLKGRHSIRADFKEVDVVDEPLVRDREGLTREDLLRLQ